MQQAIFRHGDRSPKCKLKFNFKGEDSWTQPFITLLQGRTDEIILRDREQLQYIANAANESLRMEGADVQRLEQLKKIIEEKSSSVANPNGTKAQLKPTFDAEGKCAKIVIVVKWGGEVSSKS